MEPPSRYQVRGRNKSVFGRGDGNSQQSEDSSTDAESRSRRKFHKVAGQPGDDSTTFRKPGLPASALKQSTDSRASFVQRKRSIGKDTRGPNGPRPLETAGKRIFSEGMRPEIPRRTFLPPSSSMPVLDRATIQHHMDSDSARQPRSGNSLEPSQSFSFLPTVNFDDFQSSIASYDSASNLDLTSLSAIDRTDLSNDIQMNSSYSNVTPHQPLYTRSLASNPSLANSRQPLAETLAARRQMSSPTKPAPTVQVDTNMAIRSRRTSALPTANNMQSAAPAAVHLRSPRKSVGPGMITSLMRDQSSSQDEGLYSFAQQGSPRTSPVGGRSRARTLTTQTKPATGIEQSRATAPTKSSKAKAATTSRQYEEPTTPAETRRRTRSSSRPAAGKQQAGSATPSSSGNKRQSGRMSGLGARTISPTDARRLKRMSIMQNPMPVKKPSPTLPQLEPMPDLRLAARSPSMIPRKSSLTPSSARGTPDSNTQYYTSTSSLSRSSSYQSLRAGNFPVLPRMTQSPSLSRLPTPRARNVYSSADTPDEELVPPVPAIPRAYESPKDQIDTPFFSSAKTVFSEPVKPPVSQNDGLNTSMLPPSDGLIPMTIERLAQTPITKKLVPSNAEYQHFSRPSISARPSAEETRPAIPETPAPKKKTLQPVRLPPLSLQPLSTPTAARIAALPQPSLEVDRRDGTPPPRQNATKTPSTPMTASKAVYTAQRRYEEGGKPTYGRSNTSHHGIRGAFDQNGVDSFSGTVPIPIPTTNKRQITPFTSGSLPKTTTDFLPAEKPYDEYTFSHPEVRTQPSKPQGPRSRAVSKSSKDGPPDVPQTPPSNAAPIRRKFSLSWKRSASKTADRQAMDESFDSSVQNLPEVPPLTMPGAAAWANRLDSPTGKTSLGSARSSLDRHRRQASQTTLSSINTNDSASRSELPPGSGRVAYRPMFAHPAAAPGVTLRSSSWSTNVPSKVAAPQIKSQTQDSQRRILNGAATLDKDDLAADEEMRRLAAKRKDVDVAARATDELKKLATPKPRMTPAQAITSSAGVLNIYEKGEIIDFKEGVYFCGTRTAKKHVGDISAAGTTNFGYDDERGDYNICMGDHLAYRFEVVDILGKGSFGQVVRCIDHKLGALVAVKIIRNKKRFHQQALVEVNILNKLKEWDPEGVHATLTVTSSFYFRSHLCIVTPCLSINLYELIKEHSFHGFSLQLIRRFARQLLSCLVLLQSKRIIHCDLKPENILLCDPRRADVRVIDFGSSCKTDEKVYTYIQSRFYRSPEVILGSEYGLGIDMWSFGCILAELHTGYPVFPGENEQEQLACIMEIFGPPSRDIIEKCTRRKLFFDSTSKPRVTVSSKGRRRRPSSKTLSMALKCDDEAFLDFLTLCLRWDPERRLRPDQAMGHPFITNEPMRPRQPSFDRPRNRVAGGPSIPLSTRPPQNAPVNSSSPTKRTIPSATAPTSGMTPARTRPLPQTPSTAVRGPNTAGLIIPRPPDISKGSPVKASTSAIRRQSSIKTSGGVIGMDPKRTADGAAIAASGLPRMSSGRVMNTGGTATSGTAASSGANTSAISLASAAARESMGVVNGAGGRWR